MVLCSYCDSVPLKLKKEKLAGLQFTNTDYLSLLLTPLRIRWTIPLRRQWLPIDWSTNSKAGNIKYILLQTYSGWQEYFFVAFGLHPY
jgi:hypothetical protein